MKLQILLQGANVRYTITSFHDDAMTCLKHLGNDDDNRWPVSSNRFWHKVVFNVVDQESCSMLIIPGAELVRVIVQH